MAITFDPAAQRILLDSLSTTATEIYSRWVDWAALSDNAKYGMVIRQVGSDDLGGGLNIPPYYFLQGGWRVRPQEASGLTVITGNLFVEGGGSPVVQTLGTFNTSVQFTVPVQAQGFDSGGGGGGGGATAADVWSYGARTLTSGGGGGGSVAITPEDIEAIALAVKLEGLNMTDMAAIIAGARANPILGASDTALIVAAMQAAGLAAEDLQNIAAAVRISLLSTESFPP